MYKTIRPLFLATALLAGATLQTACSDDDPQLLQPNLPANGGSDVTKITYNGTVTDGYNWTFTYSGKRLCQAKAVRLTSDGTPTGFGYTSTLSYGPGTVAVTNSSGEKITITLNAKNFIEKMQVNLNVYTFDYDSDGRLVRWRKQYVEDAMGQISDYVVTGEISYSNGDLKKIVYTEPDNKPTTLTFTNTDKDNRNGILLPTISKEMGCAGFEHLYYAGLLGRPTRHLVASVSYDYTNGKDEDKTDTFVYGGIQNTTTCTYNNSTVTVLYEY